MVHFLWNNKHGTSNLDFGEFMSVVLQSTIGRPQPAKNFVVVCFLYLQM